MSKGFHRLPLATPWSNNQINGIAPTRADERRMPPLAAHDDAMRPIASEPIMLLPMAHFEPGQPKMSREEARGKGFTGNTCSNCGSAEMQIAGHCEVCSACGTTTGCS